VIVGTGGVACTVVVVVVVVRVIRVFGGVVVVVGELAVGVVVGWVADEREFGAGLTGEGVARFDGGVACCVDVAGGDGEVQAAGVVVYIFNSVLGKEKLVGVSRYSRSFEIFWKDNIPHSTW
jgi:hypothetical protein